MKWMLPMKILIINGPNLNLLGKRDENSYGSFTLDDLNNQIIKKFPELEFDFFQSNLEGDLINVIQNASGKYSGLIINPGGYSHTSIAIRDALEICKIPKIEVHLSNIAAREEFRRNSITAAKCDGYLSGFKELSYIGGIFILQNLVKDKID